MTKITEKSKNKIVSDCDDFYRENNTLNEIAIKKNLPSLWERIKKYYSDLDSLRKEIPQIPPDNGTRISNYNNKKLGKNFPKEVNWNSINNSDDLIKSICDYLTIDKNLISEINHTKENIANFLLPNFNRCLIVLEDRYRGEDFNKTEHYFNKYKKEVRALISKTKNPLVIEFYNNSITKENIEMQLSVGGINLYDEFKFLSVDPPTKRHLGYSIMEYKKGEVKIIESGTHLVDNTYSRPSQILKMGNFIKEIINKYGVKYFVSESAFGFGQENVRTLLSENVGLFQFLAEYNNVSFITVSPKRFKLYVIGDDKADKQMTIDWSKKRFKLKGIVQEHEADSIAIGISFLSDRELIDLNDFR